MLRDSQLEQISAVITSIIKSTYFVITMKSSFFSLHCCDTFNSAELYLSSGFLYSGLNSKCCRKLNSLWAIFPLSWWKDDHGPQQMVWSLSLVGSSCSPSPSITDKHMAWLWLPKQSLVMIHQKVFWWVHDKSKQDMVIIRFIYSQVKHLCCQFYKVTLKELSKGDIENVTPPHLQTTITIIDSISRMAGTEKHRLLFCVKIGLWCHIFPLFKAAPLIHNIKQRDLWTLAELTTFKCFRHFIFTTYLVPI